MTPDAADTVVDQATFVVPDFTVKDLLSSIPSHCMKRSAPKSSVYIVWDFIVIGAAYKAASLADAYVTPSMLPYPLAYPLARVAIWALYGFWAGLFGTGLWVIAHECGHQSFSESKAINNGVGWVLHSALGVPYHSWRITHGKHHASTGHMTEDQVWVPKTRSEASLPALDPTKENLEGSRVTDEVKREMWEALGDSPIGASFGVATYVLVGWLAHLIKNSSGQARYPKGTNHFSPDAVMFQPQHRDQIIWSDIGVAIWACLVGASIYHWGFSTVFVVYLVPYLWVNHWLVLITFLQHTDPLLPHYRASEFTFPRGALSTLDRSLLGDLGSVMGWIGAHATHGISETHILHHVSSKIPHYNAWEASAALKQRLRDRGMTRLEGRPGGWAEMYRVYKECKFVEDEGDVVFFKNAHGLAQMKPVFNYSEASDSGVDVSEK